MKGCSSTDDYTQAPMKGCSSTDDYTQLGPSTAATKQVHADAAKQGDTSGPVLNGAPRPPCMLKDTAPCTSTQAMTPGELLSHLKEVGWYKDQVIKEHSLPGRPASHAQLRSTLGPAVLRALQSKGVTRMFSHQVQAIDSIIEGKQHTVIATSTASGKSLCFHVPILAALESDPRSTALLMFPTKALAQDQRTSLKIMLAAAFGPEAEALAETYDGDTSMSSRDEVRVRCQLLVTNPDMLHLSILPVHAQFSALLSNLKYVVMDEGHSYYGAFGAHTCHVIRRLRRICRQYGSDPVFIVASATIANPQQHAQMLIGVPYVHLVDQDTSPHGPQTFVFWNPPLLNEPVPSKGSAVPGCAVESLMMGSVQHTRNPPRRRGRRYERKASTESTKGSIKAVPRRGKRGRLDDDKDIPTVPSLTVKEKVSANPVAEAAQLQPSQDRAALAHHDMKVQAANACRVISEARGHASSGLSGGGKSWMQESPSSSAVVVIGALGSKKITDPSVASIAGSTARAPNKESRFQRLRREALQRFPSFHDWKQAQIEMGREQKLDELRRSSPIVEISLLLSECIKHGLRTIAFCKSRKLCELVATYTRETLKATTPHLANSFKVYRGGYSPAERRSIEADLFSGRLLAVAATNALELGVDVGSLDVTLHLGFQGTIASMRQQAGRAGRREQPSMAIYVAFDGPLDQHFMRQPEDLFERKIENAQLDASNEAILHQHLACAASELPLNIDAEAFDAQLYGIQLLASAVNALQNQGLLSRHPHSSSHLPANIFYYSGSDSSFARKVALRTIDVDQYEVVDEGSGQVLEKIEGSKAFYHIYDGAVYLHQGRTFLCRKLDLGLKVALVRPADLKYYTRVRDYKDVHVTGDKIAYPAGEASLHFPKTAAECESAIVTARFYGFNRMWQGSGQVFDSVELHLPDVMFETQAAFIRVPPSARAECMEKGLDFKEGLHAAGHAMLNVLPLYLLCNTKDIAAECQYPYSTRFRVDRLLLYDRQGAGGVGLSAQAAPMFHLLLVRAFETIAGCACEAGCPSCIHHAECPSYNTALNKASGLVILRHVLEIEAQLELRSTPNSANNVNITASCKHCTSCI
ncbi:hypothetical protein CEUSTIGMA_g9638.t1 [Chlamydomonas eustigma]|uniref:DEAD/DEAH box helicase n=1 Tax=Chlamydomonas eustigma TaxID=1157962 RepID=A0A250XHD5_9CHLO|nr:hypothetical protein CEUSTIGMA_g9638.t1 [Chlamydomonas eustigma]|eukprot:GAX82210.1 hypothetical protein CEUSTIGMA_g9638.t1 [Chlamydomonas eustigma]